MGFWCLMSLFSLHFGFCSFLLSSIRGRAIIKQVFSCFAPARLLVPRCHCSSLSKLFLPNVFVHIHGNKSVLFGCYQQNLPALFWHQITNPWWLSSQLCAILQRKGRISDSLSACGKLGLDLCSPSCDGTAFNTLTIKGEITLNSVQMGFMN